MLNRDQKVKFVCWDTHLVCSIHFYFIFSTIQAAEEKAVRDAGRAKIADRANLWNQKSP